MPNPPPLQPGCCYHVYNRGNNGEDLFREERNYPHFLKQYAHHIPPVANTFVYCLMRNHFHLLVRVRPEQVQPDASAAFGNLFKAYTLAINKAYARTGSLFETPFHRRVVMTDAYFIRLVAYIHLNPQLHGFVKDFRDWPYSSYHTLVGSGPTQLQRDEVLRRFGGPERLIYTHIHFAPETWLLEQDFD